MKIIKHYLQKVYIVLILLLVILSSKHTFAQVAAQDSLALVALYNSTGGPNWTNNTNWLNGPVSTWAGINVIDGYVYTIELINNNLSGNIPTDIGNLTGLRNLILDDNKLTGEIPSQISQLSELSVLTLSHNQMTGNLPAGLGNQNMTNLSLEFNKFTGPIPAEAGTWEFLYYLVVNDNQFTSLPNLTGLPLGSLVTVQNNKFEFDDLEPNIGVLHTYAPQDSIGLAQQKTVKYYEQLLITSNTGGTQNTYKWYKNDVLINGQTSANLIIQNVALNDAGIYKVEVKNNLVTDLTLYGRPINVQIDGSILGLSITKPENNEKWIAGETNTIRWTGGRADQSLAIAYSIDEGKTFQTLDFVYPANIGNAVWHIPDSLLTTRARIRIYDFATAEILDESENFRIKPYIITKIIKGTNGIETYRAYNNKLDKWGFGNTQAEMWPEVGWYSTWDYQTGIDPFIDKVYDQDVGDGVFKNAKSSEFTDWSSYVKAFGEHNCYWYGFIYSFIATENWKAKKSSWGGSCFGIAAANAIAFEDSVEFRANFPNFPTFVTPSTVKPDNLVRMAITQLFSHQLGNPNETIRSVAYNTSPTQTIRDLKKMLKEDNVKIRNLLFWSNDTSNPGGHAINVYKLEQNPDTLELFTVYVWDNSYPNSLKAKIIVDTSANNGKGSWEPKYAWSTWGGYYHFGLDLPATTYLNNSSLTKTNMKQTPFLLDENELKVYNTPSANIEIKDNLGNVTGFGGSGVMSNIPNSVPLIFLNGSTGPPYGYLLPKNNYSIKMNNFKNDTVNTFVFTGNKIFEYERSAATNNQTDNLFFDGGMSVSNPNAEMKTVKLLNVISDIATGSEKLFSIKSLNLSQNDSVKIVNPDEDNLDIISYGSEKTYKIEIEYVSEDKISSFSNDNVVLTANSTQKIVPNWEKTGDLEISVYVDEGNDGTIDDTLEVKNQVTGVEEEHGSTIPTEFRLEQNYPNPFNPNTSIRYSISNENNVILKVYDILGKEVATLVNERKSSGYYVVNFDASNLTSGIYFYTIRAGSFSETKKMLLMK